MEQSDKTVDSVSSQEVYLQKRSSKVSQAPSRPAIRIGEEGLEFRSELRLELSIYLARHPVQRFFKRIFDMMLALVGVIVLSPLLLVIAAFIKYDSPGPILFLQKRVGKGGRFFTMYKFRSMYINAAEIRRTMNLEKRPGDPRDTKVRNDPRITWVGRFIRRTSLDELPQLFNVLFGDMSLVGPRPALASEALEWQSSYVKRLAVEQGCTCIWQVSGRSDTTFQDQMRMDAYYVRHWSLWLDCALVIKTLVVILTGRGAY